MGGCVASRRLVRIGHIGPDLSALAIPVAEFRPSILSGAALDAASRVDRPWLPGLWMAATRVVGSPGIRPPFRSFCQQPAHGVRVIVSFDAARPASFARP